MKTTLITTGISLLLSITAYSQNCLCSPPIAQKCVIPCFTKKLSTDSIGKGELKTLLIKTDNAVSDSTHADYAKMVNKLIKNAKEPNTPIDYQLNATEQKAFNKLIKSKELKNSLEK